MTYCESPYAPVIRNLGVMNQYLLSRSLDLGLIDEAKRLSQVDRHLIWLLKNKAGFDFVGQIAGGPTLLVGEGNLSFSYALSRKKQINPYHLTATTFEAVSALTNSALENAKKLREVGITVLHGVDATKLSVPLGSTRFDSIVFQFPHAGSREPLEGHNPNFILLRDFLKSAARQLAVGGKVLVSAVDNPYYLGAFQFEDAASLAGFQPPEVHPFDPSAFPSYEHTMTHQDGSAIGNHDTFATWIFRK